MSTPTQIGAYIAMILISVLSAVVLFILMMLAAGAWYMGFPFGPYLLIGIPFVVCFLFASHALYRMNQSDKS